MKKTLLTLSTIALIAISPVVAADSNASKAKACSDCCAQSKPVDCNCSKKKEKACHSKDTNKSCPENKTKGCHEQKSANGCPIHDNNASK